ncbi:glutamate--tRNA ligase [Flammeovirgaceae bacterium SG7u.111]|nr:glutamate--tRNA ligase [Flammeovirgaceae bacterium SG7u.132]WPO35930.1 glutamate--tRNA ligase [Flammeovirgaceae bacterium SG7u.111]
MEKDVCVRFAPSPTGPLHIGGLRTALFNYLFAKHYNGKMLLRIEDTDRTRFVPGAEEYIKEALEWCGIVPDESPWIGGENGPYRQSERKDIYHTYIKQLIEEGKAYYAFDTPAELEKMREELKEAKVDNPQYNAITRQKMSNSLTLTAEEVQKRIDEGVPYVVRLKVPAKEAIVVSDIVRGEVTVHSHTIDDKILLKSDGMPTYHMASVVDDHLMEVTHVIRGEEWLPSAPFHVMLYKYLGWEDSMPQFAHLPLLLKPSGKGKLSKRDGDKLGFSVFPLEWKDPSSGEVSSGFREDGFLPEAFTNFIALLGWNPGTEQEIFSLDELITAFSAERILKAGTKFDIEKAKWFNQQYIKHLSVEELSGYLLAELKKENISCTPEKAALIAEAMQERIVFPQELWANAKFFFFAPKAYDEKIARKKWKAEAVDAFTAYKDAILASDDFNRESAKEILTEVLESKGIGLGKVMQALRLSITGLGGGPDLMLIMEVLGKDEVASRIDKAIASLASYAA